MTDVKVPSVNPLHLLAAFGSGGLLTLMVDFNGVLAFHGNALFSSWAAHGIGMVAALVFLAVLFRFRAKGGGEVVRAPLWAYLGGVSGAATVMLTSTTVNSPLALSGTLALGLAGQMVFSLAADRWGLFGLPVRLSRPRDFAALALVLAGSLLIIMFRDGAT
ncbi:DMT family transporter [Mariluticola halotolerans]|uniref:DMT family transporter n=1 Tax=Mariluticola halotolerans TaxID=2909283 RepID=UPI0026E3975E|nr:DMT family transporter [Mariluticola halotolerans]UJQ94425.1 DMT family transporter [Mariluticola halotolerans]